MESAFNGYLEYLNENELKYPVSALDFASLYPSLIMCYNFSPEYLVRNEDYKDYLESIGYTTHEINFEYSNKKIRAWTIRKYKGEYLFGLYPTILKRLFNERLKIKKILASYPKDAILSPEDAFMKSYYNTKQAGIKVFMNTFYGELGNSISPLFIVELAAGITSVGQRSLMLVKNHMNDYGCRIQYGDSVRGDTPIIIRKNNKIDVVAIEELNWKTQPIIEGEKDIIIDNDNIEVYTENGWTKIIKSIRHKTNKELYRITTHCGSVVVTEDHSLLDINKQRIKPNECAIGTELLHWDEIELDISELMIHNQTVINSSVEIKGQLKAQKVYLLLHCLGYSVEIQTNLDCYKLTFKESNYFDDVKYIKKIEKLGKSDGYVYDLETESHHFAAGVGKLIVHNTDSVYFSCPRRTYDSVDRLYYGNKIGKLEYCNDLIDRTFEETKIINKSINDILCADNGTPHLKMSYEEVLYPVVFVSKKKYFGLPHVNRPAFDLSEAFVKGLEVIKSNSSKILRNVYNRLMDKTIDYNSTNTLEETIMECIDYLFNTKWDNKDFIQQGVWNTNVSNSTIDNFANRLNSIEPGTIQPHEPFLYVIVKKDPYTFNYRGIKKPLAVGDKMELYNPEKEYEIDLEYYFKNQLTTQFLNLLYFESKFNDTTKERKKNNCKKYLNSIFTKYNESGYVDRQPVHKEIFKYVNTKYKNNYNKKYHDLLINKAESKSLRMNIVAIVEGHVKNVFVENNIYKGMTLKKAKALVSFYNKSRENNLYIESKNRLSMKFNNEIIEMITYIEKNKFDKSIFNVKELSMEKIITKVKEIKPESELQNLICDDKILDVSIIDTIDTIASDEKNYVQIDNEVLETVYKHYTNLISYKRLIKYHDYTYECVWDKLHKKK